MGSEMLRGLLAVSREITRRERSEMLSDPGRAVIIRPGSRLRETALTGNQIMSGISSFSLNYQALMQMCPVFVWTFLQRDWRQ